MQTISHRILKKEYQAMSLGAGIKSTSQKDYQDRLSQLDNVVDALVVKLKSLNYDLESHAGILSLFDEVDKTLIENNYNLYIHTSTMWDCLAPGIPPTSADGSLFLNERMLEHRELFPDNIYYRFDCDTGAFLLLSAFELMNYPVSLVEIPGHNFIRWRISSKESVNWDVNEARSISDDEYRSGDDRPDYVPGRGFSKERETAEHFLEDMSIDEVLGYHASILSGIARKNGDIGEAVKYYDEAIEGRPYRSATKNGYAWLIAISSQLQDQEHLELALKLAREAVVQSPDNNYIDTLAAVHACRGEFEAAISVESMGNNNQTRIQAYIDGSKPWELGWS